MAAESLPCLGERYTILRRIGAGGMGEVYLARDRRHGRQVAIKVLGDDYARTIGPERFLQEIRIAATLSHPNIVPLYDSGECDGRLFYVMPYIEGESLRQRLEREAMLPVAEVVKLAEQIAAGLAAAHARGIIHRDIKPENLLLRGDHVLIADFGLGRAVDLAIDAGISSQHLVVGTPRYMSPEQAAGSRLDGRSDLYSLACVVYEMLAGDAPYAGNTPQALIARKIAGEYRRLRVLRPALPRALDRTLAAALSPIPADRFRTVEEFARRLRAASEARGVPPLAGMAAVVLAVIALLAVAIGVMRLRPSGPPPAHRSRVVVGMFENRTGDPELDHLGFMAADWVTQGLQETGEVDVVPSPTALAAVRSLRERSGTTDPVAALARATGADLVVSGSIDRDRDTLVLQAQLADAAAGRLVGAVEPLRTGEAHASEALQQLRARLMGLLALSLNTEGIQAETPPTYTAYQAFSEGMQAYVRQDYVPALTAFERAFQADTTFLLPLLYASFCHMNRRDYMRADSVLRIVARGRERLSDYNRSWLDYQRADLAGDSRTALAAIGHAAELAPASKAPYNFATTAFEARLPFAAESTLRQLQPDVGAMRGWLPYWDILTSALHVEGKHRDELRAAREARERFPGRLDAVRLEARALAAERQVGRLERLWAQVARTDSAAVGTLAYEVGEELAAHADSGAAGPWFERAHRVFTRAAAAGGGAEARWGAARAAAGLGRWQEVAALCQALASGDEKGRDQYRGLLGIAAARMGNRSLASELEEQLAGDHRPFTFGEPQFQAGRIAGELGDRRRAGALLLAALGQGYPYDMDFHRDRSLVPLRGLPVMGQMDVSAGR
jgi:TolB-like protein/predicted Ser/Thr protein kinase